MLELASIADPERAVLRVRHRDQVLTLTFKMGGYLIGDLGTWMLSPRPLTDVQISLGSYAGTVTLPLQ